MYTTKEYVSNRYKKQKMKFFQENYSKNQDTNFHSFNTLLKMEWAYLKWDKKLISSLMEKQ